jgi:hypothetical protein
VSKLQRCPRCGKKSKLMVADEFRHADGDYIGDPGDECHCEDLVPVFCPRCERITRAALSILVVDGYKWSGAEPVCRCNEKRSEDRARVELALAAKIESTGCCPLCGAKQ